MIFTHSGNLGDIIFSLPTINHLTGGKKEAILHVKPSNYVEGNQYAAVKDLLLLQPCIKEVHSFVPPDNNWNYYNWPGLKYDIDLDEARKQGSKGRIYIVKRYFDQFGINEDWTKPWLVVDDVNKALSNYGLILLTPRWNGLQYDWKKIYFEAVERHEGNVFFVGFKTEYEDFCIRYHWLPHLPTRNLLELARLIKNCQALYCNQNVGLALAQGVGKEYYLVMNGLKTNCFTRTPNEHLLGREYLAPFNTFGPNMPPDSHINFIMGDKNIQR